MKNAYDVLAQKERDIVRLRREVESLRIVAPLLGDEAFDNGQNNTPGETLEHSKQEALPSARETVQRPELNLEALKDERLFSSIGGSGSRLWRVFRRAG